MAPRCVDLPAEVGSVAGVDVVEVVAGGDHSGAVCKRGHVFLWGRSFDANGVNVREA